MYSIFFNEYNYPSQHPVSSALNPAKSFCKYEADGKYHIYRKIDQAIMKKTAKDRLPFRFKVLLSESFSKAGKSVLLNVNHQLLFQLSLSFHKKQAGFFHNW